MDVYVLEISSFCKKKAQGPVPSGAEASEKAYLGFGFPLDEEGSYGLENPNDVAGAKRWIER